jgi:hypothetical protein
VCRREIHRARERGQSHGAPTKLYPCIVQNLDIVLGQIQGDEHDDQRRVYPLSEKSDQVEPVHIIHGEGKQQPHR